MNTLMTLIQNIPTKKVSIITLKALFLLICTSGLSGCLLTSPFWNQEFASHTSVVPLQAWTTKKSTAIQFECSQAYHGGLYPAFGPETWIPVSTVMPQQVASLDPKRGKIYSASRDAALPAACWRKDTANNIWYSAIRAKQDGNTYNTFDNAGLECLGKEDGKAASWFGWIGKSCTKTYFNSTTNIPFVIFRAST